MTAADAHIERRIARLERVVAELKARLDPVPTRFAAGGSGGGAGGLPSPTRQYDVIISNNGSTWQAGAVRAQGF